MLTIFQTTNEMSDRKLILFFSNHCKHCNEFRRLVNETRFRNAFKLACIDPVPGTKVRPPWVKKYSKQFLHEVPTIIVGQNVYNGSIAFKWLKRVTGVATKDASLEGSTKIAAFKEDEMLGTASNWSFVNNEGKNELPPGEFEYLKEEPKLQKRDGNAKLLNGGWRKIKKSTIDTDGQNGWQPENVKKTLDPRSFEAHIREQLREVKTKNSMNYNPGEYRPVRPRRQVNFELPQMSGNRKDASSQIEAMLAARQAEYQDDRQEFAPQPVYGGRNRYRRQQRGNREL